MVPHLPHHTVDTVLEDSWRMGLVCDELKGLPVDAHQTLRSKALVIG